MSDEIKINLGKWLAAFAIIAALYTGVSTWAVLPHRIEAVEAANKQLNEQFAAQQKQIAALETTLARIDERTKAMAHHLRVPTKD